jgi:spermidine/putrescine transport system substrate-binding protein
MQLRFYPTLLALCFAALLLSSCAGSPPVPATPTPVPLAKTLVIYGWADDLAPEVLAGFTKEYGVTIDYRSYGSQEEAIESLRKGDSYDIVVLSNEYIALMSAEGLLAELDFANIPNYKNISANFRDLAYDPGNRHSIPYNWGTDGITVRSDLLEQPVVRWADLWDAERVEQIVVWPIPRSVIGFTLKSLGYSLNSENPAELEAARQRMLELRPRVRFPAESDGSTASYLLSGEAVATVGTGVRDAIEGKAENSAIEYILPAEGAILWGDNFAVPASSPNRATAELFLDYLLRPENGAQLMAWNSYATPNEAALTMLDQEITADPLIFPPNETMRNAEIILPVSPEAQAIYDAIWAEFVAAAQ